MIVAALGVELALSMRIPHGRDRAGARRRAVHLSGLAAAAFAATLVNPYGLDIYPWVLKLLGNTFFMRLNAEWHSPDFHALGAFRFELLILLFPLVIALSRRKVSLVALGLSIFWLHMALGGERYVPLWVVVATPMLARQSVGIAWLVRLPRRLGMSRSLRRLIAMPAPPTRMTYAVLMVSALLIWSRWTQGYSYHDAKNLPTAALRHVIQRHGDRTVFHHHDWGGWLTWHGWPQMKNWIDDRAEVQGEEHLRDYLNVMAARDGWQEIMAAGGVSAVCIPPDAPLADRLATDPAWRQTYRDAHAVVFESARPAAGNLAEQ
jgi:hypothetical protein